jgi:signal transduction histidine kinase
MFPVISKPREEICAEGSGLSTTKPVAVQVILEIIANMTIPRLAAATSLGKEQMDMPDLRKIRVLLIEDDEDDSILIEGLLAEVASARYEVTWIQTYEDGLQEIERGIYDVCLLDYHLGSRDGLEILSIVEESTEKPPIIILTGRGDYMIDLRAMKYGAADFLVKDQMSGPMLERVIRYSIERKKSKDALRESERQLKHLSSALLRVQENERRAVATELHDNLGQLLTAIKFNIESVLVRMEPDESCARDLEALIPMIQSAVEQVRNIYTGLMPTVLDDLGIVATLSWFCREFQNDHPNVEVEMESDVSEQDISADLKLEIFRIVQDAFNNVAVHSKAESARVSLIGENRSVRLEIWDNGNGFDVSHTLSGTCQNCGLGLMSMQRRAELSGGSFQIESAVGSGTLIKVKWALANR